LDAIGLQSGAVLTQFATDAIMEAGPVVVPSGVYTGDASGHVLAYSLPAALGASQRKQSSRRSRRFTANAR
jgi:hypothetical protein